MDSAIATAKQLEQEKREAERKQGQKASDLQTKIDEEERSVVNELRKVKEKDALGRLDSIVKGSQAAPEVLDRLTTFQSLIKETPNAIGSKAITGPKGVTLDVLDKQKVVPADAETAIRASMTPKDYENRRKLLSLTASLAIEYQRAMLQGQGAVSNYERQYAERAKGLGDENSPAVNLYFAKAMEHKTRFTQDVRKGWQQYQADMEKKGKVPFYSKFEESDYYTTAENTYKERLESISGIKLTNTAAGKQRSLSDFGKKGK
jgi:hypothetical protein